MQRNIKLAYVLAFLKTSWFWLGIWVFYYLRFTNFAGIGAIESVLIITMTVAEIPTGAIADLLGKKKTLTVAFLIMATGNLLMALSTSFAYLAGAVFIAALGGTLVSGTFDALIYDSLKEIKQESRFDKVTSNINSLSLIAMAVSGSLSGLMYTIDPRLPFFGVSIAYYIALVVTLFLREPHVDTEKFSFASFIKQNKEGIRQLKNLINTESLALLLIAVTSIWVISDEMLESILAVEYGFGPAIIGIFFTAIFLIASVASQLTPWLRGRLGDRGAVFIVIVLTAITYIISPLVGIVVGGILMIFRESLARNLQNLTSVIFNRSIESKYRATTISAYNLIKNVPYALTAFAIGSYIDAVSAKTFALILGVLIMLLVITFWQKSKIYQQSNPRG